MPMDRLTSTQVLEQLSSHPSQSRYTAADAWDESFTSSLRADLGLYPPALEEQLNLTSIGLPGRPTVGSQNLPGDLSD
jgi:hypothetical protein